MSYGWALSDFAGDPKNNQLTFARGDVLVVTNQLEGGWWFGTTYKDGNKGYFPETFVKLHVPGEDTTAATPANTANTANTASAATTGKKETAPEPTRPAPAAPSSSTSKTAAAPTPIESKEATAQNDWVAVFDQRYNRHYYTNRVTKESSWEVPPGYVSPDQATTAAAAAVAKAKAASRATTVPTTATTPATTPATTATTTTTATPISTKHQSEEYTNTLNVDASSNTTVGTPRNETTSSKPAGRKRKTGRRTQVMNNQREKIALKRLQKQNAAAGGSGNGSDKYDLGIPIVEEEGEEEEEEEEEEEDDGEMKNSSATAVANPNSSHEGDTVQPILLNYGSFSTKLKSFQSMSTVKSSFTANNHLPQGWLHRLKNSKSVFSSNPFKREYFIVVPKEKAGGDLVLTRFKKEPTHLIQEPSSTPQQYQKESYEVYDLTKFASGISVSPEDTGVQHVFHVMEKDAVASMVLAADTASDAER